MQTHTKLTKLIAVVVSAVLAVPVLATACAAQAAVQTLDTVTDVIVGRNNKGPYSLSYTNFDPDSVAVVVNGRTLSRGKEYRADPAKSMLSFDSVLVKDAIARVTYRIVPGKSQKAGTGMSIPVSLQLLQRQDTNLQVMGLYTQDNPARSGAATTVVGVGGGKTWAGGKADTTLLLSQRTDDNADVKQGSAWDRAGVKLGTTTNLGSVKLSGSYLHAGSEFAGGGNYGIAAGKEATDLSAEYSPNKFLQAAAVYSESEETAGKNKGHRSLLNQQSIVYNPMAATKLSLTHAMRETATAAAGSETRVESNVLRLDQSIAGQTSAVAIIDDSTVTNASGKDDVLTTSVTVNSGAIPKVALRGQFLQKSSDLRGNEDRLAIGFTATPSQQVKVDVDVATLENDAVGEQTGADVKVTANPLQQVAISAGFSSQDSSKLGETTRTSVSLKANPLSKVEVNASLSGDEQRGGEKYSRDYTLSSTPTRYAKLSALLSQKGINGIEDVTTGASLELTPSANVKVNAAFRSVDSATSKFTVRDYGAFTQPWSFVRLQANWRDREASNAHAPDTAALDVSLAPVRYFTFTGAYSSNPENDKGAVQLHRTTSLGLSTKIGSVALTTSFAEKDEYLAGRLTDERALGVELPTSAAGRLSTGYKIGRTITGSELTSRTYSLGYRYGVGSDFSLSLTGFYTQWLQDRMAMDEQEEYSAEASLGLKF